MLEGYVEGLNTQHFVNFSGVWEQCLGQSLDECFAAGKLTIDRTCAELSQTQGAAPLGEQQQARTGGELPLRSCDFVLVFDSMRS